MQKQVQALQQARSRYLEQQCLVQEVEQLVLEAEHLLQQHDSSEAGEPGACSIDAQLRSLGLHCPPSAVASLSQHLQAAYAAQRLRLPAASASAESDTGPSAGDADASSDQHLGSRDHFLGVTPAQLRRQFAPSRKAAQKAHAPILHTLEQRLASKAQAAVAAVAGPGAGRDAGKSVLVMVEAAQQQLAEQQQHNQQLLRRFTSEAEGYLADLAGIQQVLQQLLGEAVLQQQPAIDGATYGYLAAISKQLITKLHLMQLQVRDPCYSSDNLPALAAIRDALAAAEQQLQQTLDEVKTQLLAYAQLGGEFQHVVKDYAAVKAQSEELDGVIARLQQVEDEAADYY